MVNRYLIYGRVQGVGFRYFVYKLSKRLNFYGSVKNLSDGSVEVIIDSIDQEKIVNEIKKGNFFSFVDEIIKMESLELNYDDFKILY